MLDIILSSVKELGIENYIITEIKSESAELFFIKKELDMRRMCDTVKYTVTVYRDFEANGAKMRGSSDVSFCPGMTKDEVLASLQDTYASALYVKNPYFELYQGKKADILPMPSALADMSLSDTAAKFTAALFAADTRDDAFINSAEVFAVRTRKHILTSAGSDVGYVKTKCTGEFIVQCRKPKDVEQYFDFEYTDLNTDALTAKVADALTAVCDRAKAERSPAAGTYDIILSGDHIKTLLELYGSRGHASMVFPGYSDYAVGKNVQGENVTGEALNLRFIPSAPYSADGIPMEERAFIENGVVKTLHGPTRFCRYMGIEPVGQYRSVALEGGTVPFDELKKGCLYPVSFSDFQMDPMDGHFKGEIRLAYYFGENGVELLSGGSINGSLLEKQGELTFSTEKYTCADYSGPFAVKLCGISVAG